MLKNRAVGIVIHDNKLLVMRRKSASEEYFTFPGGGIEQGETNEQATHRELYEETSTKIEVQRLAYELRYDNGQIHYYFLCRYVSGSLEVQPGTNEYLDNQIGKDLHLPRWLPLSDVANATVYPLDVRDRLVRDVAQGFSQDIVQFNLKAIL